MFTFNQRQKHIKYGGYCVGWTLLFREIAMNCKINNDFLEEVQKLSQRKDLDTLIEIFQMWFWSNHSDLLSYAGDDED